MMTQPDFEDVCMIDFWSFGLPSHVRKPMWPFIVQNKLRVSKKLYEINLKKAQKDLHTAKTTATEMIKNMIRAAQDHSMSQHVLNAMNSLHILVLTAQPAFAAVALRMLAVVVPKSHSDVAKLAKNETLLLRGILDRILRQSQVQ